jgi:hypothetical protein
MVLTKAKIVIAVVVVCIVVLGLGLGLGLKKKQPEDACLTIQNGPFPDDCVQRWWKDATCTTSPPSNKRADWDAKATADVKSDMSTIATSQDLLLVNQCYGIDKITSYKNVIVPGAKLTANSKITSPNGTYALIMQSDGNLVLYKGSTATFSIKYSGLPYAGGASNRIAIMQSNGNFEVQNTDGTVVWQSYTTGNPGSFLALTDDGALSIYNPISEKIWSTSIFPYSNTLLQMWWKNFGCLTNLFTVAAGCTATNKDFTNKDSYKTLATPAIHADMYGWATKTDAAHVAGCKGAPAATFKSRRRIN